MNRRHRLERNWHSYPRLRRERDGLEGRCFSPRYCVFVWVGKPQGLPAAEKTRRPPRQVGQRSWPAFFTQVHRKRNPVQLLLSTSRRSRRLSSEKPRWHRAAGFLFCPPWQGGRRVFSAAGSPCGLPTQTNTQYLGLKPRPSNPSLSRRSLG